jgi:hypothetical protein
MLAITMAIGSIPFIKAQEDYTYQTFLYLVALPPCIGVDQSLYISGWVDIVPPYTMTWGGAPYTGIMVEITKPDGSTESRGPFTTDTISGFYFSYDPTQIGDYEFVATFPTQVLEVPDNDKPTGQAIRSIGNHTFLASTSDVVIATVQEDPIGTWQEEPLPSDYWKRPISAVHRDWFKISGNWLGGGHPAYNWNEYSTSPATAHIVWTKPYQQGGLVGGEYGSASYHGGCAYEGKWYDPIVINGILYIQEYGHGGSQYYPDFVAVDIRTGEEVWRINGTGRGDTVVQRLSGGGARFGLWDGYPKMDFGQILYFNTFNQHGAFSYLWTSGGRGGTGRMDLIDAFTGDYVLTLVNVPGGTTVRGENGEILRYSMSTSADTMKVWNSTAAIGMAGPTGTDSAQYRPWVGATLDVGGPYIRYISQDVNLDEPYNITEVEVIEDFVGRSYNESSVVQNGETGTVYSWWVDPITQEFSIPADISGGIRAIGEGIVLGGGPGGRYWTDPFSWWAFSIEPGNEGQLLWHKDYPAPPQNKTWKRGPISLKDGVFTMLEKETRQWYGFSTANGNQIWGPTESQPGYDMHETRDAIAYGKLISLVMVEKLTAMTYRRVKNCGLIPLLIRLTRLFTVEHIHWLLVLLLMER